MPPPQQPDKAGPPPRAPEPAARAAEDCWDANDGPISFACYLKAQNEEERLNCNNVADRPAVCESQIDGVDEEAPAKLLIPQTSKHYPTTPAVRVVNLTEVHWIEATGNLLDVLA